MALSIDTSCAAACAQGAPRRRGAWPTRTPARSLLLPLALATLLASCAALAREAAWPPAALRADGLPPLERPRSEGAALAPAWRLADWHPERAELLVLARGETRAQLHRVAASGERAQPIAALPAGIGAARWAPRGGGLAYLADQGGDEAWRLFLWRGEGAPPQALSDARSRVAAFRWLADGQGLVWLRERLDRHRDAMPDALSEIWRIDLATPDRPRLLARARDGRWGDLHVAADGRIAATLTRGNRGQLMRIAPDGDAAPRPLGAAERLDEAAAGAAETATLAAAPSASSPQASVPEAAATWWRRLALPGSDFRQLVAQDLDGGARRAYLGEIDRELEAVAAPPRSGPLALVHNEAGRSVLRLFDPASGALRRIAAELPPGVIGQLQWHPRLPLLAFELSHAGHPGEIWVWDQAAQGLQRWSAPAAPGALQAWRPAYQPVQWRGHDGESLGGWHLAPPPSFSGPRPVYVHIHGGPAAQSRPGHPGATLLVLAQELGVHVLLPNVRGSEGQGRRFRDLDNGFKREDAVRDISTLLDWVAAQPAMDPRRVVVGGGSYGGYMALAVAVQENARIAGSIARVGISNFVSFLENTESYRRDNRRAEYGDERDPQMRAFLQRISPLTQAARIAKPLFVVHGRNDPRVPWAEARQIVDAVRANGTPVWFLTAEDEGHSFTSADNRAYLHAATLAFVRSLVETPPAR